MNASNPFQKEKSRLLSIYAFLFLFSLISGCVNFEIGKVLLPSPTPENRNATLITPQKTPATILENIPYASKSAAQVLDLYIPAGGGPFPLVIVIHGGGFMSGDKHGNSERARARLLLKEGYAIASINYRLSSEAVYPAQIRDAKTAVRFLRANAGKYKINPERFGAWGASAGGTLAALLGTTCGVEELEGAGLGHAEQSSCISAVVNWFGLVDLLAMDVQFEGSGCPGGHNNADSAESLLVGAPLQTVPALVAKTNPMNYISEDDAAFFIQHGSNDCRVPPVQSRMLAEALTAVIGPQKVFYEQIEGTGHGGPLFRTDENYRKVIDFLDRTLK